MPTTRMRRARTPFAAVAALLAFAPAAHAATANDTTQFSVTPGSLALTTAPNVPDLGAVALNGAAQTLNAAMPGWEARDATGSAGGWNLTVQGDSTAGKSAVFKEFCTDGTASNGCNTAVGGAAGPGYVTSSPATLSAGSLTLGSAGAAFSATGGSTGSAPTHSCSSACVLDGATPVKVASAETSAGMGTWSAGSYGASSLGLSVPTTVRSIGSGNKAYRVVLLWTLSTGP